VELSKEFVFYYEQKGGDIFVLISCDNWYLFKEEICVYWCIVIPYILKRRKTIYLLFGLTTHFS